VSKRKVIYNNKITYNKIKYNKNICNKIYVCNKIHSEKKGKHTTGGDCCIGAGVFGLLIVSELEYTMVGVGV
jgi:hypothetical protein